MNYKFHLPLPPPKGDSFPPVEGLREVYPPLEGAGGGEYFNSQL